MWPAKYDEIPEEHLFSDREIQDMVTVMQNEGAIVTQDQADTWRKLVQNVRYELDMETAPARAVQPVDDDDDEVPF